MPAAAARRRSLRRARSSPPSVAQRRPRGRDARLRARRRRRSRAAPCRPAPARRAPRRRSARPFEPRDLALALDARRVVGRQVARSAARMRSRSCSAKCGVEAPISWRTSSTVTSWPGRRRSGCSAWLIWVRRSVWIGAISSRLSMRDCTGSEIADSVADQPAAIVDAADRVARVARLDVEQVAADRQRQRVRGRRSAAAGRTCRSPTAARRPPRRACGCAFGEHEPVARVVDAPAVEPVAQARERDRRAHRVRRRRCASPARCLCSARSTLAPTTDGRREQVDARSAVRLQAPRTSGRGSSSRCTNSSGLPVFAAQPAAGIAYAGSSAEATDDRAARVPDGGALRGGRSPPRARSGRRRRSCVER